MPQDYVEASRWYRKAAFQGYVGSQIAMAEIYFKGSGVEQDYAAAYAWAVHAAKNGGPVDLNVLTSQLTPQQIRLGAVRAEELQQEMDKSAPFCTWY